MSHKSSIQRTKRPSLHGDSTARELLKKIQDCDKSNTREVSRRWFEFLSYLDKNVDVYAPNDLRKWFQEGFTHQCDQATCRKEEYYGRCWILFAHSYIKQGNLLEASRVFEKMYTSRIGTRNAYVYRAHSELCQLGGSSRRARKVIEKGIENCAQPLHLLDFQDVTEKIRPGLDAGLSSSDSDVDVPDAIDASPNSDKSTTPDREDAILTNMATNFSLATDADQPDLVDIDTFEQQSFMSRPTRPSCSLGPPTRIIVDNDDTEDENMRDAKGARHSPRQPFQSLTNKTFATPRVSSNYFATSTRKRVSKPPITPNTVAKSVEKSLGHSRFTRRSESSTATRTETSSSMATQRSLNTRSHYISPIPETHDARESSATSSEPSPPEVSRSVAPPSAKSDFDNNRRHGSRYTPASTKHHPSAMSFDDIVEPSSVRKRQEMKMTSHPKPVHNQRHDNNLRASAREEMRQAQHDREQELLQQQQMQKQKQRQLQRQQEMERRQQASVAAARRSESHHKPQQRRSAPPSNRKNYGPIPKVIYVNGRKYVPLDVVGRGGSGLVFKVISDDRTILALKQIRVNFDEDHASLENYRNEIELLEKLKGKPHTIMMYDYMDDRDAGCIYMVFEFGEIDLAHILKRKNPKGGYLTDILEIQLYWKQMLVAVSVIHDERIVHGDLKPANFLCVEGELKLIDFGIAKAIQNNDTTNIYRDAQIGTLNYMSPEAITEHTENAMEYKLGRSADMWSLGCILHQICFGKTPFSHLKTVAKIHAITNPDQKIAIQTHDNHHVNDIIRSCLKRDPTLRPTLDDLLNHSFLRGSSLGRPCTLQYLERFFSQRGYSIRLSDCQDLLHEINNVRMFEA